MNRNNTFEVNAELIETIYTLPEVKIVAKNNFLFSKDGNLKSLIYEAKLSGYWAWERLADSLPINYLGN